MMRVKYWSAAETDAKCPFFLRDSKRSITCEGVAPGTEMMSRFPSVTDKVAYMRGHCFRFNSGCEIARLLQEKYKEK